MKTIEQKAKAYDEVLHKAKRIINVCVDDNTECRSMIACIQQIFPELKKSEDEKIRKNLREFLLDAPAQDIVSHHLDLEEALNWLEKQGEQKVNNKIQMGKKYKCIAPPRYSTFFRGEIYKPEDEFLCSLMNFCSDCFEPI